MNRLDDAAAAYTDLIGNFPDSELRAEAYLGLGRVRYDQRDYAGSWVALQDALGASPTPAQAARARYHTRRRVGCPANIRGSHQRIGHGGGG